MGRWRAAMVICCVVAGPSAVAATPLFQSLPPAFLAGPGVPAPLPPEIVAELAFAAQLGDAALIEAVARLSATNPDRAAAIAATAIDIAPDLASEILAAGGGEVTITPAAGPLAIPLTPLLLGAGGAAGVAGVAAGGGGSGDSDTAASLATDGSEPPSTGEDNEGGDDAGDPPNDPRSPPIDTTRFETAEYRAQPGLVAINAATAYARGLNGSGVVVAIIDGAVDATDPELTDAVINAVDLDPATADDTRRAIAYTARLIGARRDERGIHGVAPAVTLFSSKQRASDSTIAANTHAARGAQVLHNGWNTTAPPVTGFQLNQIPTAEIAAYRDLVTRNAVVVHAAGDGSLGAQTGSNDPSLRAGLPHLAPDLQPIWLAVTATGTDGNITTTANRCGVAAAWCIAAPAAPADATVHIDSTARAAPHVSGAAALLAELFPELGGAEIAARLLATANQDGKYADSAVYGQGLLDLATATEPLGAVAVAAPNQQTTALLADTSLRSGLAFGDSLQRGLASTAVAVSDSQGAVFAAPISGLVEPAPVRPLVLLDSFNRFADAHRHQTVTVAPDVQLGFSGDKTAARADLTLTAGATKWHFAWTDIAQPATVPRVDLLSDAWLSPFRSMAPRRIEVTATQAATRTTEVVVSAFVGEDQDTGEPSRTVGATTEVVWRADGFSVAGRGGALVEKDTVLGAWGTGAFAFAPGTRTYFVGASATAPLPAGLRLDFAVDAGITMAKPGSQSVLTEITPIRSQTVSAGIAKPNLVSRDDVFGVVVHQPLRVASGSFGIPTFAGRDAGGAVRHDTQQIALAPSGRAIDLEAYYHRQLPSDGAISLNAMWRRSPGHARDASDEGLLSFRWRQHF